MIDNLPPLREMIDSYDLSAQKSLGQCFLFDLNLTTKIARLAGNLKDQSVIEIGPGPGGLTRALLAQGAYVTAIEYDKRCAPILEKISQTYPERLRVIYADALTINYNDCALDGEDKPKIIANLPYNIGTKLLLNWLLEKEWPPFYESMTLMFQKEVAQRIVAMPNSKHYGRLSVLANWRAQTKIIMELPPQAFTPAPKVSSAVVHIVPRLTPQKCDVKELERVTKLAFGQRRKMLRQNLKEIGGQSLLESCYIDGTRRAETLTIEEFISITEHVKVR